MKGPVASRKHLDNLHLLGSEKELWFFVANCASSLESGMHGPTQMILCKPMKLNVNSCVSSGA